jgi:predicted GNAT family N-acyltransferase
MKEKKISLFEFVLLVINLSSLQEQIKDLKIQLEYQKHLTNKYYNRWEFVEKQLRGKEK